MLQPHPYAVMDRELLATLEVSRILRQTEERVERSRLMLAHSYDVMCRWWSCAMPAEIVVSGAHAEKTQKLCRCGDKTV